MSDIEVAVGSDDPEPGDYSMVDVAAETIPRVVEMDDHSEYVSGNKHAAEPAVARDGHLSSGHNWQIQ